MANGERNDRARDLGQVAAATGVVLATVAAAVLLYYLIDILLLLFLGIVVSATLQPWHAKLCRWGVPRGVAVVLIYLLFIVGLVGVTMLIAPVIIQQLGAFTTELPDQYAGVREHLRGSDAGLLRVIGQRLPTYTALMSSVVALSPSFFQSIVEVTASVFTTLAYVVTVLALGIYWTLELPRVERLIVSLLPVQRRARTLTIWHEIESKLGGFMRGQGQAMLAIGVVSAVGYWAIGLPNVLVLAVLAGLCEAVPLIGPVLAAVPALAMALPLGMPTVLLVLGFTVLLQAFENNVLIPRIMSDAVGTSALVGLVAVLAFGTLYGVLGIFIAIPITAVVQVIVDRLVINRDPGLVSASAGSRLEQLMIRAEQIRQQVRVRLRARDTRMGIDPGSADHVVDAADQRIEEAVEQVGKLISSTHEQLQAMEPESHAMIVDDLHEATEHLAEVVDQAAKAGERDGSKRPAEEPSVESVRDAAERAEGAVERVHSVLAVAQEAAAPDPERPVVTPGRRARK